MGKKFITTDNLNKSRAKDLYEYWLSLHGFLPPRKEPTLSNRELDVIFAQTDKESGKIGGEKLTFFFHGTLKKFKRKIENEGLQAKEGVACFTRKITHALESFALMGNYTMISNGMADTEIKKLVKAGIIDPSFSPKQQARAAFKYWCQDEIREKLGLLTVWYPPENTVALDRKTNKIHKRHFALYNPGPKQNAVGRRRELGGKAGERLYLHPRFLMAELKPTKEIRLAIANIAHEFAHGENILTNEIKRQIKKTSERALYYLSPSYSLEKLTDDIIQSIVESTVLSLVREAVYKLLQNNKQLAISKLSTLQNLQIPYKYLRKYRRSAVERFNFWTKNPESI